LNATINQFVKDWLVLVVYGVKRQFQQYFS